MHFSIFSNNDHDCVEIGFRVRPLRFVPGTSNFVRIIFLVSRWSRSNKKSISILQYENMWSRSSDLDLSLGGSGSLQKWNYSILSSISGRLRVNWCNWTCSRSRTDCLERFWEDFPNMFEKLKKNRENLPNPCMHWVQISKQKMMLEIFPFRQQCVLTSFSIPESLVH